MTLCDIDVDEIQYVELMDHQKEALQFLGNGKILWGGVGVGKSATAIAYYTEKEFGRDIYVITTAKKRDSLDWEGEAARFGISVERDCSLGGKLTVESWNNLGKFAQVTGGFFIFDEQRLVGNGAWVKNFLKIAKSNRWILLTATPGDRWLDYAPVFVANGWYNSVTDFKRQHVIYEPFRNYPVVKGYIGTDRLEELREEILVEMPYTKHTIQILNYMSVGYDQNLWNIVRKRWNPYENKPIKDVAELFRLMRKVVNSDPSRIEMVRMLMKFHPRLIIFYNFDYELEILRGLEDEVALAEWNGHKHEPIPDTERWVYLVQYNSGSESWNCISTDAMILYSLTYSYKNFVQCRGRIDRINTKYEELFYYILYSNSWIDQVIKGALERKTSFNERDVVVNGGFDGKM